MNNAHKLNKTPKHFPEWMGIKEVLHNSGGRRNISERQVWWTAVGENVGVEINGKSEKFSRPVLIFKKLSNEGFMGIPLTSQPHSGSWYVNFEFQGCQQYAALAQARVMSVSRLYGGKCYGELPENDFRKICDGFEKLYSHPKK